MGRKRRERKTPKRPKVLYSVRVDGELDELIKLTLMILNKPYGEHGPGERFTLTEMMNAILYDVFFDVEKHNTPRNFGGVLSRVDWATNTLPLTREMVDTFFDVSPEEVEDLLFEREQQKRTPHS
jgi:hypothetical protein